jgi:hypothetical protein
MSAHDLTYEEAIELLDVHRPEPDPEWDPDDGPEDLTPTVHCFVNAGFMLLGADWSLDDVQRLIEKHGARLAGPEAIRMGHGLVVVEGDDPRFFATRAVG